MSCAERNSDPFLCPRRGLLYRPDTAGGFFKLGFGYEQGGITPFLTVTGISSAGNAGGNLDIQHTTLDTMAHPLVAYLPSVGTYEPGANALQDGGPSSGVSAVTANRFAGGVSGASGQNPDSAGFATANA